MTSTTDRRVQLQKFGKHRVGVLGAAVVAASVVAFGSAGIAHAYTIVNNTGWAIVGSSGLRLPNGGTWNTDQSGGDFQLVGDSSTSWHLDWNAGEPDPGFTYGTTTGSASFTPIPFDSFNSPMPTTEYLTLGGTTKSFVNSPCRTTGGGGWYASGGNSVSFVRTNFAWGPPIRTRGAVIVVNEKPMKIWGPQTSPVRGVVPKGPAPQAPVAAVSPVSSTLPAQPQSVAKTATPHRAAARRAAVTASRSAPPA